MKKYLLLLCMSVSLVSFSQEENKTTPEKKKSEDNSEVKTLFKKKEVGKTVVSGWGGITAAYQQLNGEAAYASFARGGVLLNHKLTLGIGTSWAATASEENKELSTTLKFSVVNRYTGFLIGYEIKPLEPVHFSSSLLLGGGYISYHNDYYYENTTESNYYYNLFSSVDNSNLTFVARPSIGVDINIVSWFKVGLEAAYIYAPNKAININKYQADAAATPIPVEIIKANGMSGFTGGLSVKFGVF